MTRSIPLLAALVAAGFALSCDEGRLVTDIDSDPFEVTLGEVTGPDTINVGNPASYSIAILLDSEQVTADAIDWNATPAALLSLDTANHAASIQVTGQAPGPATLTAIVDHPDLVTTQKGHAIVVMLLGVEPVTPVDGDTTLTAVDDTLTVRARGVGDPAPADSAGLAWTHKGAALSVTPPLTGRDTLRVTAQAPGTDTLIFRQRDGYCREGQCVDTILVHVAQTPARLEAQDSVRFSSLDATATPSVEVFDRNSHTIAGAAVSWALVDPADSVYAALGAGGMLTARSNGAALVSATAGAAVDTVAVVVHQAIADITASADVELTAVGATDTVSVTAVDPDGSTVERGYTAAWSSRSSAVADVSPMGDGRAVVTANGEGSTYVVATAESRTDSVRVTVSQAAATVTVAPDSVTLGALDASTQLAATVKDANGNVATGAVVTWSSTNEAVAEVSEAGEVTAKGVGTARVAATSGTAGDTAVVVVQQVPAAIAVTDSVAMIALGETAGLSAAVTDAGGSSIPGAAVTWTVVSGAGSASVAANGTVMAVGNGMALVEGSADNVRDTAVVVVHQTVDSVVLDSTVFAYQALLVSDTLRVTAYDSGGTAVSRPYAVAWSSSATGVVAATQLPDTVRARIQSQGDGSAVVVAAVEGKADTADVTVAQAVDAIVITPGADTLNAIGFKTVLTAQPVDANGQPSPGVVAWTALDPAVATIGAADTVTAITTGTARFTATTGGVEDTAVILVRQVAATVALSPGTVDTLLAGDTLHLTVVATDSGGTAIASPTAVWAADPDSVATVDAAGIVTGQTVAGLDSARISATVGPASDTVEVYVGVAALTTVAVTPNSDTITALTDTAQLTAQGLNQNGNPIPGETFTWQSRDTGVATVTAGSGRVTAVGNGQTYIVATSNTNGALADSALVLVQQVPTSVAIDPTAWTFNALNDTRTFTATARDSRAQVVTGATFTWSDRLSPVIEHLGGGQFRGDAVGSAYAVVIVSGVTGVQDSAAITVQQIPASIVISPALDTIPIAGSAGLAAAVADSNGNALSSPPTVIWASLDPGTATVDGSGTVSGLATGTANIVAYPTGYLDAVMDTASVVVAAYTLDFDGGDYVTAGTGLNLDPGSEAAGFTLEAWVYPTSATGDEYLISKGGGTGSGDKGTASYGLYLKDGKPAFFIRYASGNPGAVDSVVASGTLATNTWHHLAVTFDNATSAANLYVNGSSVATATLGGTPVASTSTVIFGASATTPADPFTGRLDELRFWSGVRTPAAIAGTYQTRLTGAESGLLAYWPFDEGTGGTAADLVAAVTATLGTAAAGDGAEPTWTAESPTIP